MRILFAAIALLVCGAPASAQKAGLSPVQVIWKSGGESITISEAKESGVKLGQAESSTLSVMTRAIRVRGQISIECYFRERDFADAYPDGADYDVRWYYYMSTRKMLMSSNRISLSAQNNSQDGLVLLESPCKQNPRPGWWEVQIVDVQSGSEVVYADQSTFQILLK